MDKYDYVLAELKRRKGQLAAVAEGAGVTRRTLTNMMGEKFSPRMETLNKVHKYLKETARRKVL